MYRMNDDEHNEQSTEVPPEDQQTAVVKWFNNRAGYGFLTVADGDKKDTDVFVHHTALQVETDQYKYLVAGEYVTFSLSTTNNDHEFQATSVRGVNGGKLMCETRRTARAEQDQGQEDQGQGQGDDVQRRNARPRGAGPREGNRRYGGGGGGMGEAAPEGYQWVLVPQRGPTPVRRRGPPGM